MMKIITKVLCFVMGHRWTPSKWEESLICDGTIGTSGQIVLDSMVNEGKMYILGPETTLRVPIERTCLRCGRVEPLNIFLGHREYD